jgi:hypothetical protein
MKKVWATAFLGLCVSTGLSYADEGYDACVTVYQDSTRNLNQSVKEQAEIQSYFNLHCEKNGETKTSSASANLEFIVKAIPFKFSGNSSSAKEKMQEFCKTVSSYEFNQSAEFQASNLVVVDALSNFNQCLSIAGQQLIITHTFNYPESVTISGRWKTANTDGQFLNQVVYDKNKVVCTSTNLTKDGKVVTVDDQKAWAIAKNFSLSCKRKATVSAGITNFERSTIGLSTTLGDYSIVLQADKLNDFAVASQAAQRFDQLNSEHNSLLAQQQQTAKELQDAKEAYSSKDSYSVILYHGNNLGFFATLFAANPRNFETTNCPKIGAAGEKQLQDGVRNSCEAGYEGKNVRTFLDYNGGPCGNTFSEIRCERP